MSDSERFLRRAILNVDYSRFARVSTIKIVDRIEISVREHSPYRYSALSAVISER